MAILNTLLRRWRRLAGCLLGCGLALAAPALAQAADAALPPPEYQVKAVFLFNFAQFVEWPAAAFPDAKAPLVIGVVGSDPFGAYLDNLVRGEKIGEHPMVVRRLGDGDNLAAAQVLFVGASDPVQAGRILARVKGRPVLTVGDAENFSRLGGLVRFVTENGKLRLRINASGAKDAGLTVSSKLLRWATIVTPEKG